MMHQNVFRCPPCIQSGMGAASQTGPELKRLGVSRALLITDNFLFTSGAVSPVIDSLNSCGIEFEVYSGVNSEPTLAHVNECAALLNKGERFGAVIGCGGGSPIDVAKAVSAVSANPGHMRDFMGQGKIPNPGLPIVAVPTTAGTGSEATLFTIITDTEKDVKMLIGSPWLMPSIAIVDPALTMKMPKHITAATGIDALTHAIEAYVSRKAQPMSDIAAREAIRLISRYLPIAFEEPGNEEARANTLFGALLGGIAFSNASVALVHGMSRPVGALFHVPHGVSNAALLGEVTEFSLSGNYGRYAEVARLMGVAASTSDKETAEAGAAKIRELIARLEIPGLEKLGLSREKLDPVVSKMAEDAIASGSPGNNPRLASKEEIVELYYRSL